MCVPAPLTGCVAACCSCAAMSAGVSNCSAATRIHLPVPVPARRPRRSRPEPRRSHGLLRESLLDPHAHNQSGWWARCGGTAHNAQCSASCTKPLGDTTPGGRPHLSIMSAFCTSSPLVGRGTKKLRSASRYQRVASAERSTKVTPPMPAAGGTSRLIRCSGTLAPWGAVGNSNGLMTADSFRRALALHQWQVACIACCMQLSLLATAAPQTHLDLHVAFVLITSVEARLARNAGLQRHRLLWPERLWRSLPIA